MARLLIPSWWLILVPCACEIVIGEQSEPLQGSWTETFVLLCMPICGISLPCNFYTGEKHVDDFLQDNSIASNHVSMDMSD